MLYADFENILVLKDNGKQNPKILIRKTIKNKFLSVMAINNYKL